MFQILQLPEHILHEWWSGQREKQFPLLPPEVELSRLPLPLAGLGMRLGIEGMHWDVAREQRGNNNMAAGKGTEVEGGRG